MFQILIVLLLGCFVSAKDIKPTDACARSCDNSLSSAIFSDWESSAPYDARQCNSRLYSISSYICLSQYCPVKSQQIALALRNATCQDKYRTALPPLSILDEYTPGLISQLRQIRFNETFDPNHALGKPVTVDPEFFSSWFETLSAWDYAAENHYLYSVAIVLFWTAVIVIGLVNKAVAVCWRILTQGRKYRSHGTNDIFLNWMKRNLLLPATFGLKCAQSSWGATIPPRLQSLTIIVFLILNIGFSVMGYKLVATNYYFGSTVDQALRYVSDRTGIMSFTNFPVIWLFGMRNNLALWLTGWDFGTYNNFHRWTARIATLQAIVHSIGYTIIAMRYGGWDYLFSHVYEWYWMAGVAATAFMVLLIPLSMYWIRRSQYEPFLLLHIILSVLVLLFMLGHVSVFDGEYDFLFWVPVFIWIFDRVLRLLRIVVFQPSSVTAVGALSYDEHSNVVELRVPLNGPSVSHPGPGTFCYLMVLDDTRNWESHPFTVASVSSQPHNPTSQEEHTALLASASEGVDTNSIDQESKNNCATFIIRPYSGFTARLRDLALKAASVRVLVEGPYGTSRRLSNYDHICFIVGGTGIVTPLSYLPSLISQIPIPCNVDLHWAVREPALAASIIREYLAAHLSTDEFSLRLYMSNNLRDTEGGGMQNLCFDIQTGRPNIQEIVAAAAANANGKRLAVVACGPEGMLDDARLSVVNALNIGQCHIDYFQDSFSW